MLRQRLTLGPILIAALIGVVWLDEFLADEGFVPGVLFSLVALLIAMAGARELNTFFQVRGARTSTLFTSFAVAIGLGIGATAPSRFGFSPSSDVAFVCTAVVLVLISSFVFYSRHQTANGVLAASAATMLAFSYLGMLGGFFILLRVEFSGWLVLGLVLVTKSCDIGAYFTGRWIGRHKLIEWLSPGKTWEGLAGGLLLSTLIGLAAAVLTRVLEIEPILANWQGAVLGATFGLIGQFGDLVASLLKRDAGVKDASNALPGFGGVLDVLDSPLLVAPVAYWLLVLFMAAVGP